MKTKYPLIFKEIPGWSANIKRGNVVIYNDKNKLVGFYCDTDLCTLNSKRKDYPYKKFLNLLQAVRWLFLQTQKPTT